MGGRFDPRPLAAKIWADVGYHPEIPRDLLQPIMETYDLFVVHIPQLSIVRIGEWLEQHGRPPLSSRPNRRLAGCLIARRGTGIAFIDGTMPLEERRLALAHELAHFVAHYLEPRRRALHHFGEAIRPVLDGDRQTTVAERLSAILANVPLGSFEDFLTREEDPILEGRVADLEDEADMLALELLAPQSEVLSQLGRSPCPIQLAGIFGLPRWAATTWATFIAERQPKNDPFIVALREALKKNS